MSSKIIQEYLKKTRDFLNGKISATQYDKFFWDNWSFYLQSKENENELKSPELLFISTAATSTDAYCTPEIMGDEPYDGKCNLSDEQLKQEILEKYKKHFPNESTSESKPKIY